MSLRSKVLITAAAGLLAAGALSACNLQEGRATASLVAPPAAAATGASHALVFSDDGSNAKLALADQPAALMLECSHGSRTVHVTHASAGGPAPTMVLVSEGAEAPMKAERQAFEGQTLVLGQTSTDAPALAAFRKSGRISVRYGVDGLIADAHPETFFAACEKAG